MAERMTLAECARAHGKGASYYRVLRARHRDEFPKPDGQAQGRDTWWPARLAKWDEKRQRRGVGGGRRTG